MVYRKRVMYFYPDQVLLIFWIWAIMYKREILNFVSWVVVCVEYIIYKAVQKTSFSDVRGTSDAYSVSHLLIIFLSQTVISLFTACKYFR